MIAQFIAVFKNIKACIVFEICAVKNAEFDGGNFWRSEDFFFWKGPSDFCCWRRSNHNN